MKVVEYLIDRWQQHLAVLVLCLSLPGLYAAWGWAILAVPAITYLCRPWAEGISVQRWARSALKESV